MDGYLMKRGDLGIGALGWKKRFFIQQGSSLQYFTNQDSIYNSEPLGEINLKDVTVVKLSSEFTGGKAWNWGFDLQTPKRTFVLCAETEEDMIRWTNDIVAHIHVFRGEEPSTSPQFSASEPWVKELMSATRGALIRIKNNSNSTLSRNELKLEYSNQKWSKLPPEIIRPNSIVEFGTQNHNVLSGTSGSVVYKTEDVGLLKFYWSNPLAKIALGTKATFDSTSASFKLTVETTEKSSTRNLLMKSGEMFEVTYTVEGNIDRSLTFSQDLPSDEGNKATGGRTTSLRIHNVTSSALMRSEYSIANGTWTNPPPENISSNQNISFGSTSNQKLTGTSGNIIYESTNKLKYIKVNWNNPFIGESTVEVISSDGLRVDVTNPTFGTSTDLNLKVSDDLTIKSEKFSYSASSFEKKKKEENANKRISSYNQVQSPETSKKVAVRAFEAQTIGQIRDHTSLFSERRKAKKEKRAQERAKIMNRFKLVAYELNNRPAQQQSSGFMSLFKEKRQVLPTCIEYLDLESVEYCPIDKTDLRKRKGDKRYCGLCGGVFCPKCIKTLGIGPHDIPVCIRCYDAVNEVERMSDYKSSLIMRDNHPIISLHQAIFPLMADISSAISKLGVAIENNPKDQQTKILEKKVDDLFNVFNNYFKRLNGYPAKTQREQKLVGNMKRAFAEYLQENLPTFKIMKRQISMINSPPASPKANEVKKVASEPEVLPFEQLIKKEVVHKDEPIQMTNEIEDLI